MPTTRVTIGSPVGLHARPARLLVEAATKLPIPLRIGRTEADAVDARSILAVMSLGVSGGEEVVLVAEGEGAEPALAEIAALLSSAA
ncbi:HPr family phosphocarrier protein [Actinokineospora soli]|uniref:HPr family phosphocarrier protein n=1 Tax=Actinokineospora soli TaxID=1048753 RepID=A0ABW2TJQ9_9PSEU